jgi:DNA repair protein RecN (Recombination protein N)
LIPFFEENDLDYENETILDVKFFLGKSAFYQWSGQPRTSGIELLIDIHSQQQTQELSDENVQFGHRCDCQ